MMTDRFWEGLLRYLNGGDPFIICLQLFMFTFLYLSYFQSLQKHNDQNTQNRTNHNPIAQSGTIFFCTDSNEVCCPNSLNRRRRGMSIWKPPPHIMEARMKELDPVQQPSTWGQVNTRG